MEVQVVVAESRCESFVISTSPLVVETVITLIRCILVPLVKTLQIPVLPPVTVLLVYTLYNCL